MNIKHYYFSESRGGKHFVGTKLLYEDEKNNKAVVTAIEYCEREENIPDAIEKAQKRALLLAREQLSIANNDNASPSKKSGSGNTEETPKKRRGRPPKNKKAADNPAKKSDVEAEIDHLLDEFDKPKPENPALNTVFKTTVEADPKISQYDGKTLKEILEIHNGFLEVILSDHYRPMVADEAIIHAAEELKKENQDAS